MKIAIVVFLAAVLAGCAGHQPERTEAAPRSPIPVRTFTVQNVEWSIVYETTGTVRARTASTLSSRIMGYIHEIRVEPGDRVHAGQLIATIESRELDTSVRQAQAEEQAARSAVTEAENGIVSAKAQLTLAQATFRRMQDLHKQASISDQEFDEAQARLRTAEAALEVAESKRRQLEAKIAQASQGVESAGVMQSYARIVAPFAGVVTEKPAQPGQLATPGTPIVTIERAGGYRLEVPVEESLLSTVRLGQRVRVALDAYGQTLDARIDEIVPAVSPESRSFIVKASLPSSPNLKSGLFGRLLIERAARDSLVVPVETIQHRGELQSVFVVEDGVARTRMVSVGELRDNQAEILTGLAAGDRVIRTPIAGLADGLRVEVR